MEIGADMLHDRVAAAFGASIDPWPVWKELSERGSVVESTAMFLVTRHPEVKSVLRDASRFSSNSRSRGTRSIALRGALTDERRDAFDEIAAFHGLWMQTTDGEKHDRLRRIAHRAFTPRRIAELGDATRQYVGAAIDAMADKEVADIKNDLAIEVPLLIMTDLLGVPAADRELIKGWSSNWFEYQFVTDDRIFLSRDAQREFRAYVTEMLVEHRRNPNRTDLVSALVGAEHDERLAPDEVAGMFFMLLFAGHETTSNLIGTGMLELLRNPDEWRAVTAEPTLAPRAVEELLRFASPVQYLHRFTLEDVELGGVRIPAGATTTVVLAAANRDPAVFDDPDVLEIRREASSNHVALGFGPHFCLGGALARLEGSIAVGELARRLPELELETETFEWRGGSQLRGLASLPVRVGLPRAA